MESDLGEHSSRSPKTSLPTLVGRDSFGVLVPDHPGRALMISALMRFLAPTVPRVVLHAPRRR